MEITALQLFWYVLLGVLLAGYAILDGFDLGVGILHPLARDDRERRVMMNSIGPLWDGNEVWLVVFGGALFAAFPKAYAASFSGLYLAFMLLLFCLIFRGVSMEFRSKRPEKLWRRLWDAAFFVSSTLATFLFGVAVGNSMHGLPLAADGDFADSVRLVQMLHPFPVCVGLFAVTAFAMHGAIYLNLKTEGELHRRVRRWMWASFFCFLAMYMVVTAYAVFTIPRATASFRHYPWAWVIVALNILAIANIPRSLYLGRPLRAFLTSACVIAAFTFLFGLALFPNLIVSSISPDHDLSIPKAASTEKTLGIMAIIAAMGIPFVLAYTAVIYWVFRGKVVLHEDSY
ncbi:MAG: cytochrome d ubiquinol oxidase subunit II [Phycisphaeraceae bacterium]|nr:cytochrome d ubiquinol oxidase subunit II [Phycisphaeraceae bacterium]